VPPTDASIGAQPAPNGARRGIPHRADSAAGVSPDAGTDPAADPVPAEEAATGPGTDPGAGSGTGSAAGSAQDSEETLDLRLPGELLALLAEGSEKPGVDLDEGDVTETHPDPVLDDLLGHLPRWGATTTPAGVLHLVPVRVERDLPLISRWMNDPAVAAFWGLAGPEAVAEKHLRRHAARDGRSVPCLGLLDGAPMSYWEVYRADLAPLARHYPARPHDTGVRLLIGGVADRGRGLGSVLLRAIADLVLAKRPSCARVIAEPDIRNTPSISALLSAGFRFSAEVDLPDKRAALMVRERALRDLL
jgi:RimJ/RimL family protein N-acetyltransferase